MEGSPIPVLTVPTAPYEDQRPAGGGASPRTPQPLSLPCWRRLLPRPAGTVAPLLVSFPEVRPLSVSLPLAL